MDSGIITATPRSRRARGPECRVLRSWDQEWLGVLDRVERHDFYHLPQYQRVEEFRLGATAHLFTYSEGDYLIALPLLLRPIEEVLGRWNDATSAYGYCGPIASHQEMPEPVVSNFQMALRGALLDRRVIAVFSTLHPLLRQDHLLAGLGELHQTGQTISIDLTISREKQVQQYRQNFRRRIKKQRHDGDVVCMLDEEKHYLGEFIGLYNETMQRVHAAPVYFFGKDYFHQLPDLLGSALHLFVALIEGEVAAAGLYTLCDGIVQYHLGGTRNEFLKASPMGLVMDTVRLWANEVGAHVLHLGGGVGAQEDSLFQFKAGFSDRRDSFSTWRWVVDAEKYQEACKRRAQNIALQGLEPTSTDYFPAYRSPTARRPRPGSELVQSKKIEKRIYLSAPHLNGQEFELVREAFASNWIAPLGPHVDAFESELAAYVGAGHAVALSSGTAAIHLALRLLGVRPGDEVLCSTLTFSASANPIVYEGGTPVFLDSEAGSWNMDPGLLNEELDACAARNCLPRAVIVVDLYGQSANYEPIIAACARYEIPIVQDCAEALGASYKDRKLGTQGRVGVFSFNGNKIITTSGGGMLVSDDASIIERARFLASQARDPAPHYQHSVIGFNYRLSNVLAAIGRGQLGVLNERIAARRRNFERYRAALGSTAGIEFMPIAPYGEANYWLTCIMIDPKEFGATSEEVRLALAACNIEARPIWKPLHLQPVFAGCRARGGACSERVFAYGLCLPSGSNLTDIDHDRICSIVLSARKT